MIPLRFARSTSKESQGSVNKAKDSLLQSRFQDMSKKEKAEVILEVLQRNRRALEDALSAGKVSLLLIVLEQLKSQLPIGATTSDVGNVEAFDGKNLIELAATFGQYDLFVCLCQQGYECSNYDKLLRASKIAKEKGELQSSVLRKIGHISKLLVKYRLSAMFYTTRQFRCFFLPNLLISFLSAIFILVSKTKSATPALKNALEIAAGVLGAVSGTILVLNEQFGYGVIGPTHKSAADALDSLLEELTKKDLTEVTEDELKIASAKVDAIVESCSANPMPYLETLFDDNFTHLQQLRARAAEKAGFKDVADIELPSSMPADAQLISRAFHKSWGFLQYVDAQALERKVRALLRDETRDLCNNASALSSEHELTILIQYYREKLSQV